MICRKRTHKDGEHIWIFCPGCQIAHSLRVKSDTCDGWGWNGSLEAPTFTPSLLVSWGPKSTRRCHSFINDGKIRFLNDSQHDLAGKTVPLPELPDWLAE